MSAREKIAEAIWRWNRPIHQHAWWATLHEDDREEFLGMADAALEALNLTEEWGVADTRGHHRGGLNEGAARAIAERFENKTARSRLVGPWETQP